MTDVVSTPNYLIVKPEAGNSESIKMKVRLTNGTDFVQLAIIAGELNSMSLSSSLTVAEVDAMIDWLLTWRNGIPNDEQEIMYLLVNRKGDFLDNYKLENGSFSIRDVISERDLDSHPDSRPLAWRADLGLHNKQPALLRVVPIDISSYAP